MGLGKCTGWPFCDLDPRSRLWHWLEKFACLRDKVRTTHPITTKHGSFIALVLVITWLDFGEVLLETVILAILFYKFWMCFFKVKHYFGHISGMVGPIDVKRKGSALVGYWVQCVTLPFDLTHDLDLGCFKGVGGAVRFLVVGTIGQGERPPRGQLWMEQCLTSLKYWPI